MKRIRTGFVPWTLYLLRPCSPWHVPKSNMRMSRRWKYSISSNNNTELHFLIMYYFNHCCRCTLKTKVGSRNLYLNKLINVLWYILQLTCKQRQGGVSKRIMVIVSLWHRLYITTLIITGLKKEPAEINCTVNHLVSAFVVNIWTGHCKHPWTEPSNCIENCSTC